MCKHFSCVHHCLGDGVPCQQTTASPADLPLGPRNPVLSLSSPSQPTSNRGHSRTGITQTPWSPTCACPASHVQSRSLSPTAHLHTCTHTCAHTMPMAIPLHSAHTPLGIQERPSSQRDAWPEGGSQASPALLPPRCNAPHLPLTASWVPGTREALLPAPGVGRGGAGGPEEEGEGVGAGL